MFSFDNNGNIYKFSPYTREDSGDFIIESMSLPLPDGLNKKIDNKYSISLNKKDFDLIMYYEDLELTDFKKLSLLLHEISNKGYNFNNTDLSEREMNDLSDELDFYFIGSLEDSSLINPKSYENAIVGSLYHGLNDARNMIHAFAPMDDDTIKNIAKTSPKGAKDHNMNHLNPLTDVIGMIVNSVGKDGISIAAVGLKGLSAITDRLNKAKNGDINNLKLNSDLAIEIDKILGLQGASTVLFPNGFDLKNMQNVIGDYLDENFSEGMFKSNEDYKDFKDKYLRLLFDDGDNSLMLSQIMTLIYSVNL